jgi:cell division protein FtsA
MAFDDLFVGIDIGTSKVAAVVCGARVGDPQMTLLGRATVDSTGLRKGVVIDIARTSASVAAAVAAAEREAGVDIHSATVGIAGSHIRSLNSRGVVAVRGAEITAADVRRCVDAAKATALPPDREIIHSLPQSFMVDSHEGVRFPVGMAGRRLEASVHVVTASVNAANNVVKSVKQAGFEVEDVVLEPLASAASVLDEDEKELGVCVLDLGCGTTDLAIYIGGELKHTQVLGVGGDQLTRDLSNELLTPVAEAERIKREWGVAAAHLVDELETVDVPSVGGRASRKLERKRIAAIIEARLFRLFETVGAALVESGYAGALGGGVVVTGGGASLRGIAELAERALDLPVRRGLPRNVVCKDGSLLGPDLAVALGLCFFARRQTRSVERSMRRHRLADGETTGFFKITRRFREFLSGQDDAV